MKEELNKRIYTLYNVIHQSYERIAKVLGIRKSRVQKMVMRRDSQEGHVEDEPCKGCQWKITRIVRRRVDEIIDKDLRLSLQEIARKANVGFSFSSICKIVSTNGFCLKVPKLKLYQKSRQKEKHTEFAHRCCRWSLQ